MAKDCNHKTCEGDSCRRPSIPKPRRPIPKMSAKRKKESMIYTKTRKRFLSEKFTCEARLEECTGVATEIHHKEGRGLKMLDCSTWLSVCRNCHKIIELNPQRAKQLGLSNSRITA